MKKIEIVINGEHEEAIGHEILSSVYGAVQGHGYTDVSVKADTIRDVTKGELKLPAFLQNYQRGDLEAALIAAGR